MLHDQQSFFEDFATDEKTSQEADGRGRGFGRGQSG